ncbi:transporter substrate-binding domain-containing protein [Thalassospira alkalitolerans]|uniref:Amidase n=1 Tax=Thalassospira alkalitolerans TaxID=1293890 RepID=A0A1Y2LIL5_9PROT|nr:transporter substrate-binding domain-containing protein [Thalassospira alkalitolerans]OSQ50074.1 hypothetical protein TALK_00815 [Thalassospira alkalitolerans]
MGETHTNPVYRVGFLYSVTGPYRAIAQDLYDGARMALAEVNQDDRFAFRLVPEFRDPAGVPERYTDFCESLIRRDGCRHIIGTITSLARKEVLPTVEKYDALLWYPCPYEGFECSENVIYTGANPNQHILPLFEYVIPKFGRRVYLTGSNYIWGWETNRIGRELIHACDGEVLGEKYLAIDSVDIDHIIEDIKAKKPDFILNNLIGNSSYAFIRAYQKLGAEDPEFAPSKRPIVSCNLTECELSQLGAAGVGHLSTAIYFANQTETDAENTAWLDRFHAFAGPDRIPSVFVAQGYATVKMLAESIRRGGTDDVQSVRHHLMRQPVETPFGNVRIDASNNHAALTPLIGQIGAGGWFDIVSRADHAIEPDPYLVHFDADAFRRKVGQAGHGNLRVVGG